MHSQHALVAGQSSCFLPLLPGPAPSACRSFQQSSSRLQSLTSPGSGTAVAASASFGFHGHDQQFPGPHSPQGLGCEKSFSKLWFESSHQWPEQLPVQGLSGVLLRTRQHMRRLRSQADTEADSLEDLNLEDLDDDQLDDLFETYGEVIKGESEPAPTSSEVDDDGESLAFAVALAEAANEVKAGEIQVLCVKPLVYWTRFFVIATGFSRPQVDAIGKRMRDTAEEHFKRTPRGDLKPNAWTLLDFGDVVVHIFYPKERSFYNLEEFYGNATRVELPFEPLSQMH